MHVSDGVAAYLFILHCGCTCGASALALLQERAIFSEVEKVFREYCGAIMTST